MHNIVKYYIDHCEEGFFKNFRGSHLGQRVYSLQLYLPRETTTSWQAMGIMMGMDGRRPFIVNACESVIARLSKAELVKLVKQRADILEVIDLCLKA